jgi:MFS family permease
MRQADLLRLLPVGVVTLIVPLGTAVNIAFPSLAGDLGLPVPGIQWFVICYILTYASLVLLGGRIGDIVGHRTVFRFGLAWSAAAFLACALAPGFGALLVCRALQGMGAALVVGCGPALATSLFPEAMRGRALAACAAAFAAGSALGPLLGGVLVQVSGWPAVFWVLAPIALAALLFAVNRAPEPLAGTLGAAALLCLAGFVLQSHRSAQPIIDLALFQRPGFAVLHFANMLVSLLGPPNQTSPGRRRSSE